MKLIVIAVLLLFVLGCATSTRNIEMGMSREQVREELGKPRAVRLIGNIETWRYYGAHIMFDTRTGRVRSY